MKISIITPSYNSGKYIEKAIHSVLSQDYKDWEHIVVDGGSTDNTLEVVKKYAHVKWISEPDKGQSDAMNKGYRMSDGDIVGYLNADDWYNAGAFSKVIQFFEKHDELKVVVGNIEVKEVSGSRILVSSSSYDEILLHFKYEFPNNPVGYFYKREVQKEVGEFPLSDNYTMDYWFLLNAYRKYTIGKVNEIFGVFWNHGDNKTSGSNSVLLCKAIALDHLKKVKDWNRLLKYQCIFFSFFFVPHRIVSVKLWLKKKMTG